MSHSTTSTSSDSALDVIWELQQLHAAKPRVRVPRVTTWAWTIHPRKVSTSAVRNSLFPHTCCCWSSMQNTLMSLMDRHKREWRQSLQKMAEKTIHNAEKDTKWATTNRSTPLSLPPDRWETAPVASVHDVSVLLRHSRAELWEDGQKRLRNVQTWLDRMPAHNAPNRELWRDELSPHLVRKLPYCFAPWH